MTTVAEGPALSVAPTPVKNRVCLIVHDGWGISSATAEEGNAIAAADTTNMDSIAKNHAHIPIEAHGTAVGLNEGLMGNSEVGHLNIGAGRIVWQDIVRIDVSIKKKTFHSNEVILEACKRAKEGNGRMHFLGLISDGGVHSHINHLFALLETAKEQGVPEVYVHFLGDGRDTAPRSAVKYLKELGEKIQELGYGQLATIVGRYYAMDRDKRWDRVRLAALGLLTGKDDKGGDATTVSLQDDQQPWEAAVREVEANYAKDVTDEFLKPIVVPGKDDPQGGNGRIKEDDTLFFFNYRSDRMREIVSVFGGLEEVEGVRVPLGLGIYTMSQYKKEFPFRVAFPPQAMTNVLAEWLASKGVRQAHVAETEKYAHVTFFFNGGVEKQFEGEDRYMIPSPRVATYDLDPKMSVHGVAAQVCTLLDEGKYEFVMCNFAPPDMVGHTGNYEAAVQAISETDQAVGAIYEAAQRNGYVLMVTADHGNAEQMKDPKTGNPHTAHTTNPVPFIMAGPSGVEGLAFNEPKKATPVPTSDDAIAAAEAQVVASESGTDKEEKEKEEEVEEEPPALCDVAPTVLAVMGLDKPGEMGGRSLLK